MKEEVAGLCAMPLVRPWPLLLAEGGVAAVLVRGIRDGDALFVVLLAVLGLFTYAPVCGEKQWDRK